MMTPKMPSNTPQKMVVPQARTPMMQGLRDGGGSMKVFGDGHVPKMSGHTQGGENKMSTGGKTPTVTPRATMHESGESRSMKMRERNSKSS